MQNAQVAKLNNPASQAQPAKRRIGWVDGAKALAILAIIVGHFAAFSSPADKASFVPWAHGLLEFCYSFHVPLFFMLSGYCMRDAAMSPAKIGSMFAKTFLPYLVTGLLIIAVGMNFSDHRDLVEWLAALAYGTGGYGTGEFLGEYPFGAVAIGVIWFLPALFLSKLIVTSTARVPMPLRFALMTACFFGGWWWAGQLFLPMSVQEGIVCSWYVFIGVLLKKYDVIGRLTSFSKSKTTTQMISATVCHVYVLALGLWYMAALATETLAEPNYCISWYHQPIIDWLGTVCAAVAVCFAAVRIEQACKVLGRAGALVQSSLELLGRSTLPVFAFHGVTIAWAANLIDGLAEIAETGVDPVMLFIAVTAADVAVCCLASLLAYMLPGLSYVYFPGARNPVLSHLDDRREERNRPDSWYPPGGGAGTRQPPPGRYPAPWESEEYRFSAT